MPTVESGNIYLSPEQLARVQRNNPTLHATVVNQMNPNTGAIPVTGNTAADIINSQQDRDIAEGQDPNDPPTRSNGSLGTNYQNAWDSLQDLLNAGKSPSAPSFTDTYNDARDQYNVDSLENLVNDYTAEEEALYADLRAQRTAERDKPVAMNVIEGRIGEEERVASERMDYIRRQKQTAINQLNSANAAIENMMNLQKLDYDTARNSYNDQFSQQIQMFNTVKGIVDDAKSDEERAADNARANLNIIYGAIKDGGMDRSALDPAMQYRINSLELQAGLPSGFYQNIAETNPEGKILSTTTRTTGGEKYADVIIQNKDGSFSTRSIFLGGDSSGNGGGDMTDSEFMMAARSEMSGLLSKKAGGDGYVSPQDYKSARSAWVGKGLLAEDFDKAYAKQYINSTHYQDYGVSYKLISDF